MGLVESIACEWLKNMEDLFGMLFCESILHSTCLEFHKLLSKLIDLLLAHDSSEDICLAQCVSCDYLRDLHYLFLIDNYAVCLLQDVLKARIRVFDCGETVSGLPYAVMEYAGGGTLRRYLSDHGKLSLAESVQLLHDMLCGLAALHAHGMVHRDVKPDNIWLTADGGFRLGDFGLVLLPGYLEEPGRIFGTAAYMSPEQARDSTSVDARSDLYSLAVVLAEALTGERLRPKGSFAETIKFILSDRSAPPVDRLKIVATEKLAILLGRMLDTLPALRPPSAAAVLAELDAMTLPKRD